MGGSVSTVPVFHPCQCSRIRPLCAPSNLAQNVRVKPIFAITNTGENARRRKALTYPKCACSGHARLLVKLFLGKGSLAKLVFDLADLHIKGSAGAFEDKLIIQRRLAKTDSRFKTL